MIGGVALALTASLTACGKSGSTSRSADIRRAYEACRQLDSSMTWDASTSTLTLTDQTYDEGGLKCVLDSLRVSEGMKQRLDATTALMGNETTSEAGLNFDWSLGSTPPVNVGGGGAGLPGQQIFVQIKVS